MRIEHQDMFSFFSSSNFPFISVKNEYFLISDVSDDDKKLVIRNLSYVSVAELEDDLLIYGDIDEFQRCMKHIRNSGGELFELLYENLSPYFYVGDFSLPSLSLKSNKTLQFNAPVIMGIVNATPDSFYGESRIKNEKEVIRKVKEMVEDGAGIIDIGGESTRPGSDSIDEEEEIKRVIPIIKMIKKELDVIVSVDTYRVKTASLAVEAGADIVNDITSMNGDREMVKFLALNDIPVVLMHMKGTPKNMQKNPFYTDVIGEITDYFNERIQYAEKNNLPRKNLIIDPGIGFGKRLSDNLEIMRNLEVFKKFNLPLLLGTSRKSFIGKVLNQMHPGERLEGTLATTAIGVEKGVNIFRVHDVKQNSFVANMAFSIMK